MSFKARWEAGLARQLGRPEGLRGRFVAGRLNRYNADTIGRAIEAAGIGFGSRAADVGFGGGVGLTLLLKQVGPHGQVDGIELSATMLASARRRLARECSYGRLTLHSGSLTALPLPDDALDAVITVNTVYFVDDLVRAGRELARVLVPGGRAVVAIADPEQMRQVSFTEYGFRLRPVASVEEALSVAGLDVSTRRLGSPPVTRHLVVGRKPSTGSIGVRP